jgi:two-component system sensor histidine kinase/response regulator
MSVVYPAPAPLAKRSAEERYRAFVQEHADGIWRLAIDPPIQVYHQEQTIVDGLYGAAVVAECNENFARLCGKSCAEDLVGGPLNAVLVRDDPASEALLRAFIRGGFRLVGAETHSVGPGGEPRTFVDDLTGLIEEKRLTGLWGTRRDVTAARRAEADLRRAKEAAETASRAKSTFLADVSHEIRTPLNGVLGMAHLVLQDDLAPGQRDRVRTIKTSAESLLHVLNDLLDFSKMEAGKFQLSPVPFHLADELGETLRSLALRAHEKGLQLSYFVEPVVPAVVIADPDRLRQVVVNLIGNAIKFTERGEVALRVNASRAKVPGREGDNNGLAASREIVLHFDFVDTGIGIPSEQLARVFEPFEQAEPARNRHYGGTGLGLAIVTRLAALMGGAVTAESQPGRGSTFRFTARVGASGTQKIGTLSPPQLAGLRALVVDGHAHSRKLLVKQLAAWGMECAGAGDPDAALEVARASGRPYDLLVLDAGRSVGETLHALRQLRACGVAQIALVCTPPAGWSDPPLAGAEATQTSFLPRPFKPAELLETLVGVFRLTPPAWLVSRRSEAELILSPAPLRVLLAEDNSVNQAVAVGMLEAAGHTARVVGTGRAALTALAEEPFDVVLMDLQMPEMDGFGATAAIRAAEAGTGRRLPVIALTARAMAGDREECLRRGMDDFIAKPIQPRELYQALGRLRPQAAGPLLAPPALKPEGPGADIAFDAESFRTRCGGREELARQVARLFLGECPRYLEQLRSAAAAGDAAALHAAAHMIKGSVGNLSAGPSYAAAKRLDEFARVGDLESAAKALAELLRELDRLRPALRGLVAGRQA